MDFTREPIIETIITPKEGCKLVVRSSKSVGQEEYFVDAVEIVAFGHAFFYRSLERPKAFLVPVSDYEILEVREARMVLKNVGLDRSIKIGGGREASFKPPREVEKIETPLIEEEVTNEQEETPLLANDNSAENRGDKKRDRRRHYRKRRGKEEREEGKEEVVEPSLPPLEDGKIMLPPPDESEGKPENETPLSPSAFSALLQPPPTLISETINRYRQNELFKGAFYLTEDDQYKPHDKVQDLLNEDENEEKIPSLEAPTFVNDEKTEIESFHQHEDEQNQWVEINGIENLASEETENLVPLNTENTKNIENLVPLNTENTKNIENLVSIDTENTENLVALEAENLAPLQELEQTFQEEEYIALPDEEKELELVVIDQQEPIIESNQPVIQLQAQEFPIMENKEQAALPLFSEEESLEKDEEEPLRKEQFIEENLPIFTAKEEHQNKQKDHSKPLEEHF